MKIVNGQIQRDINDAIDDFLENPTITTAQELRKFADEWIQARLPK